MRNQYVQGAMKLIGRALTGDEIACRVLEGIMRENWDPGSDLNQTVEALEQRVVEANPWPENPPVSMSIDYPLAEKVLNHLRRYAADKDEPKSHGLYQCFHCGTESVIWGADFSFEDYGRDGEGIVHTLTCANCGAEIEYYISLEEEE